MELQCPEDEDAFESVLLASKRMNHNDIDLTEKLRWTIHRNVVNKVSVTKASALSFIVTRVPPEAVIVQKCDQIMHLGHSCTTVETMFEELQGCPGLVAKEGER